MYTLSERIEELAKDRDRVRLALEQTEASLIGYKERARQLEQAEKTPLSQCPVSASQVRPIISVHVWFPFK